MRNKHKFEDEAYCRCPKCGEKFPKRFTVEYETNQKGDVIKHKII